MHLLQACRDLNAHRVRFEALALYVVVKHVYDDVHRSWILTHFDRLPWFYFLVIDYNADIMAIRFFCFSCCDAFNLQL